MSYNEQAYEPSELDGEIFLSDAPLSLLMRAIQTQFDTPAEYRRKDYVDSFITKYRYCKEQQEDEDEEYKEEIQQYYIQFMSFMEDLFQRYLGVGFPRLDELGDEDALELVHLTYRFFIKNIKKNFLHLITNYLQDNKEEIVSELEDHHDVTIINFREQEISDDDSLILSNLDIVVQDILSVEFNVDDFFKYTQDIDYLEGDYVKDQYESFEITGNFVPKYVAMTDVEMHQWLETKVRNAILSSYSKRTKKLAKKALSEQTSEQ